MTDPLPKTSVRRVVAARLDDMPSDVRAAHSTVVCARVVEAILDRRATCVMLYLAKAPELDLDEAIEALLEAGVAIAVPKVDETGHSMQPVHLPNLDPSGMTVDRFGIRTPAAPTPFDAASLEVVVVPGLAFDTHGGRLGRGAGFYDRFLKRLETRPFRIGTCFNAQLMTALPTAAHDEPMDAILTEETSFFHNP